MVMVSQLGSCPKIMCSNHIISYKLIAQLVECSPDKCLVIGSNPVKFNNHGFKIKKP